MFAAVAVNQQAVSSQLLPDGCDSLYRVDKNDVVRIATLAARQLLDQLYADVDNRKADCCYGTVYNHVFGNKRKRTTTPAPTEEAVPTQAPVHVNAV